MLKAQNFVYITTHHLCGVRALFVADSYSAGVVCNLTFLTCLHEYVTESNLE